jgi:hypothetical protein
VGTILIIILVILLLGGFSGIGGGPFYGGGYGTGGILGLNPGRGADPAAARAHLIVTPRGILKSMIICGLLAFALILWLASRAKAVEMPCPSKRYFCWQVKMAVEIAGEQADEASKCMRPKP